MKASATSIDVFKDGCNVKYIRKYVLKNMPRSVTNRWAALGNIIHAVYEKMFRFEEFGNQKWLEGLYTKCFNEELKKANVEKVPEKDRGWFYNYGKKLLLQGYNTLRNNDLLRKPISVEEWFKVPVGEKEGIEQKDHIITGKMDAVFDNGSKILVIDYKTGKETPDEKTLRRNVQLTTYSFVISKTLGKDCDLGLLYPKHEKILLTNRTPRDHKKLFVTLAEMTEMDKVTSEVELPTINPSPKACQYCELGLLGKCEGPAQIGFTYDQSH